MPKKGLLNKHIFITGAGSGLGRRMAIQFAKLGAKVTLVSTDLQSVQETQSLIENELSKKGFG